MLQRRVGTAQGNFAPFEPVLALRESLLTFAEDYDTLGEHLNLFASFARKTEHIPIASNAVRSAISNANLSNIHKIASRLEGAQIAWMNGEQNRALREMHAIVDSGINEDDRTDERAIQIQVKASCLLAHWLSITHAERAVNIKRHLDAALTLAQSAISDTVKSQELHEVHFQYGRFMDKLFRQLLRRKQSPEYEEARRRHDRQVQEIERLKEIERKKTSSSSSSKELSVKSLALPNKSSLLPPLLELSNPLDLSFFEFLLE